MTRRKPADMSFEHWTERQIREAQERGAFDDLPGAGKPIPGLDRPWSPEQWAADLARREGVDLSAVLPPSLRLRRDRERLFAGLSSLTSEQQVRDAVAVFDESVREAFRRPTTGGPPMTVGLMDVDAVLRRWRELRTEQPDDPEQPEPTPEPPTGRRTRWWWRRAR